MGNLPVISEIADIDLSSSVNALVEIMPEHGQMLQVIQSSMPEIKRSTSLFCKTQSQYMDNMLTVSHPTPLRNLRQILAEMSKTQEALKQAHFSLQKKEIELKMKERAYHEEKDELKKELLNVEMFEIMSQADSGRGYISGAIRKLANYTEQYNSIVVTHNLQNFNELDFEKEEEKYHIMKAFEQAVCAARTRGGLIDEGNMIYLTQIGINGAVAQHQISCFFREEQGLIAQNKAPTHEMFLTFLANMAKTFEGCSKRYAEIKGMKGTMTESAALQVGDDRLLKTQEKSV